VKWELDEHQQGLVHIGEAGCCTQAQFSAKVFLCEEEFLGGACTEGLGEQGGSVSASVWLLLCAAQASSDFFFPSGFVVDTLNREQL
jgi:hypothetical protein